MLVSSTAVDAMRVHCTDCFRAQIHSDHFSLSTAGRMHAMHNVIHGQRVWRRRRAADAHPEQCHLEEGPPRDTPYRPSHICIYACEPPSPRPLILLNPFMQNQDHCSSQTLMNSTQLGHQTYQSGI